MQYMVHSKMVIVKSCTRFLQSVSRYKSREKYRDTSMNRAKTTSDPNGGNVHLSSAATCTSQFKLRSLRADPL